MRFVGVLLLSCLLISCATEEDAKRWAEEEKQLEIKEKQLNGDLINCIQYNIKKYDDGGDASDLAYALLGFCGNEINAKDDFLVGDWGSIPKRAYYENRDQEYIKLMLRQIYQIRKG